MKRLAIASLAWAALVFLIPPVFRLFAARATSSEKMLHAVEAFASLFAPFYF